MSLRRSLEHCSAVILSDIVPQINCFHFVMYIHNRSALMPSGTCYRTCGMVLGMDEMNVILDEEHELSIMQIAGETLYISLVIMQRRLIYCLQSLIEQ